MGYYLKRYYLGEKKGIGFKKREESSYLILFNKVLPMGGGINLREKKIVT